MKRRVFISLIYFFVLCFSLFNFLVANSDLRKEKEVVKEDVKPDHGKKKKKKWYKSLIKVVENAIIHLAKKEAIHLIKQVPKFVDRLEILLDKKMNKSEFMNEGIVYDVVNYLDSLIDLFREENRASQLKCYYSYIYDYQSLSTYEEKISYVVDELLSEEKVEKFLEQLTFAPCEFLEKEKFKNLKEYYESGEE